MSTRSKKRKTTAEPPAEPPAKPPAEPSEGADAEKYLFTEERLHAVLLGEKKKLLSAWLTNEEVKTPKAQLEEATESVESVYQKFKDARKKYYEDNHVSEVIRIFESFFWTQLDYYFEDMMQKEELKQLMFKHLALICQE